MDSARPEVEASCTSIAASLPRSPADGGRTRARIIAFYLPQFHPIPENDMWWGRGFTEWTNVAKAKPLFRGHYQPRIPADLGFYDLRVPDVRAAQADLARKHGVEGFCYWHYWFAGKRLLERPMEDLLKSGEPRYPFCLAWANESWTGIWHGAPDRVLQKQTYPGFADHEAHFHILLKAFSDSRYITVDARPMFLVYQPRNLPDSKRVTDFWRDLAARAGLPGLHLVAVLQRHDASHWHPYDHGFDAAVVCNISALMDEEPVSLPRLLRRRFVRSKFRGVYQHLLRRPMHVYGYREALPQFIHAESLDFEYYPCLVPNWDNTPRSGLDGLVLHGSTPELFRTQVRAAVARVGQMAPQHKIVFVKSWNEWAEGNYLEPDLRYGRQYLEVVREEAALTVPQR